MTKVKLSILQFKFAGFLRQQDQSEQQGHCHAGKGFKFAVIVTVLQSSHRPRFSSGLTEQQLTEAS
jgi:hypothetical protein